MSSAAPTCATADVAALVPERVGTLGASDFSATTNPKAAQVTSIIAQVIQEVQAVVGPVVDSSLAAYATMVVATGSAARVERAFTNAVANDRTSKYEQLMADYRGDNPLKIGGMLMILADAQNKIAQGGVAGINDPAEPVAVMPDPTQSGYPPPGRFPQTSWAESY